MLREILNALRKTDSLGQMISAVGEMLRDGRWMFEKASAVLLRVEDWAAISDELYARDRRINHTQQKVREEIVTHLSLGHQADLSACLILMSVVKDAERIGDYCKNIFEVGKFYKRAYTCREFVSPLEDVRTSVVPLFEQVESAFVQADKTLARKVLDTVSSETKTCDVLIRQLLSTDRQMPADEAVAYVLMARFYKRVAAHLGNIASSVISPVPLIDYRDEKL
ncbi:MAG: PhoU family transcriptional regulator [Planctomycetes bacterium]|nr:PhoU family transcriptional regulator [Planctomycetota bacterium]